MVGSGAASDFRPPAEACQLKNGSGRVFYPQMESLRGIAALVVVLFHVSQSVGGVSAHLQDIVGVWFAIFIFTTQTIFNGSSAVILFFVLSGFVLGLNAEPHLSVRSYAAFIVRRIFRLLPLAIVAVMFSAIMWRLFSDQNFSLRDILENALLLHTNIDGPLWSLRVEVILSLAFPLLFFCLTRTGPAVRLTALLTIFFATLTGYTASITDYWAAFALGIVVPSFGRTLIEEIGSKVSAWVLLPVFALYTLTPISRTFGWYGYQVHLIFWTAGAFYIVSWAMYGRNAVLSRALSHPFAMWLGRVSFSLYVLHYPIVTIVKQHLAERVSHAGMVQALVTGLVALPLSLVAAEICFWLVESPTRLIGRQVSALFSRQSQTGLRSPAPGSALPQMPPAPAAGRLHKRSVAAPERGEAQVI